MWEMGRIVVGGSLRMRERKRCGGREVSSADRLFHSEMVRDATVEEVAFEMGNGRAIL